MREWTAAHPNEDFSPLDYLHTLPKTFICTPGKCEDYSSNGYEILGFVLAAHYGANDWETFNWWMMFPDNFRK
jgi:CubicO group peptidase (beta-lactamase class C family)